MQQRVWWRGGVSIGWLPPLAAPAGPLVNRRTGTVIAADVTVAADRTARRRGLLDRDSLPMNAALVLVPCRAIHTWRMRFPIDVLFVDATGRIIKARERMPAWKIAAILRAYAVVELAAGRIAATGTRIGDEIRCLSGETPTPELENVVYSSQDTDEMSTTLYP